MQRSAIEVNEVREGYFCPFCRPRKDRDEIPAMCERHQAKFRRWLKKRFPGIAKLAEMEIPIDCPKCGKSMVVCTCFYGIE